MKKKIMVTLIVLLALVMVINQPAVSANAVGGGFDLLSHAGNSFATFGGRLLGGGQ